MVQVRDLLVWLDGFAPFRYAESWDQCGLQVGDPEAKVDRVLVALDPGSDSLGEAERLKCQCLVTHHPLIFRPLNALRMDQFPGKLVCMALRKGIHVIAAHTNLDVATQGTNDQWVKLLSLEGAQPLEINPAWKGEARYVGMGRIGALPRPMRFDSLIEEVRGALNGVDVRVVGEPERQVRQVALCTGSGASLLERVIALGADAYITGDVKYHEAQRAHEAGLALIDVGHFASERLIVAPLAAYLRFRAGSERIALEVIDASEEKDPFRISSLGNE